jgi:hypothetical protein
MKALRNTLETRLREAGLLITPCCGDPLAGVLRATLELMGPAKDLCAWHLSLEVQETARLERDSQAGIVVAVPWSQSVYGMHERSEVKAAIEQGFNGLISQLLKAHEKGGPPSR